MAFPSAAQADEYANIERTEIAVGHYARARALLIEALAEFERGRRVARPDILMDSEEWRLTIISKTEELNRLLDPQPRVTKAGVQYRAHKSLLRRESKTPAGHYNVGVQDGNSYGEEQRKRELDASKQMKAAEDTKPASRAKLQEKIVTPEKIIAPKLLEPTSGANEEQAGLEVEESVEEKVESASEARLIEDEETAQELTPPETPEEDSEISQAIEAAIKERLSRMDEEGDLQLEPENE